MQKLEPWGFWGKHFNIKDEQKFQLAIQFLKESLFDEGATLLSSDNLITWNRNFSFLRDEFFQAVLNDKNARDVEKSIVWRSYILLYFAAIASKVEGDFLELGCHTGYTASLVIKKINFKELKKKYYLYDLFEWKEGDEHPKFEGHTPEMFENVKNKFVKFPFVKIIKGSVPQSFSSGFPEKIAFAHIDMNHPTPEAGALEMVLPRLSSGGVVVFDDYGWWGYSEQKIALDPIITSNGLSVLELPTGQALLIKA